MAYLIFWRHADAEPESETGKDTDRVLSKAGRKDASVMAKWLHKNLPDNTLILCSPAKRCLETLSALQQLSEDNLTLQLKIVQFLSIDSTAELILQQVANDDINQTILIIGHQPNLGLVIAKLLGIRESSCVVKKGAVWWLRQRSMFGQAQTYLYAVRNPRD